MVVYRQEQKNFQNKNSSVQKPYVPKLTVEHVPTLTLCVPNLTRHGNVPKIEHSLSYNEDAFIVVVTFFYGMTSVKAPVIIIALYVIIAVSLIVPYGTFALRSNPCPKYCDGCCIPRPKNSTSTTLAGGGSVISPGGNNVPNIHGPINSTTQAMR